MIDWTAVEIGDRHVAALSLFLRDGPQAWEQLHKQEMTTNQGAAAYMQMFHAAFTVAVRRKFAPTYTIHEIVRYVAKLRIELKNLGDDDFNPRIAENSIRGALGDPTLKNWDKAKIVEDAKEVEQLINAQSVVLFDVLLSEEEESGAGVVEEYVRESVDLAQRWVLERQTAQIEGRTSTGN